MDYDILMDNIKKTHSDQIRIFTKDQYLLKYTKYSGLIHVQSITKFFVSLAIGILYTHNLIKIEDPVKKYLPKFPHDDITILNILTHTSGIEHEYSTKINKKWVLTQTAERFENMSIDFDDFIYDLKRVNPIGQYHYNNFTPNILTLVIQTLTGMDIDQYLDQKMFRYMNFKYKWLKKKNKCFAAYGLFTDSDSLIEIGKMIINNGIYNDKYIISKRYLNMMQTKYIYDNGLFSEIVHGLTGHRGADGQYFFYNKHHKLIIVRLVNEIENDIVYDNFLKDVLKYYHLIKCDL